MQIDQRIFKWLSSHKVLSLADKIQGQNMEGIYELDSNTTKQFEVGSKIGELLDKINKNNHNYTGYMSLDKLKDSNTAASRLYNWNILTDAMKKMGITLDQDIKSLIVAGDTQMLAEVLKDIYEFDMNQLEKISIPSSANSLISNPRSSLKRGLKSANQSYNPYEENRKQKIELKQAKLDGEAGVDLNNLDVQKNLSETQSLLEFFLIGISRHFMLRPKQAATLLSNGNKYFAHVLVKGLKSDFNPVEKFLQDIYVNVKRLLLFIEVEEANIPIILNTLKPGLLSKNEEVSLWSCRIFSKMSFDLANLELLAPAYDWFTSQMGGLYSAVMCLRRHQNLKDTIVSFMVQISRYNLTDFLTVQLRKIIENNKEYIDFINLIFSSLTSTKMSKEELLNSKIIEYWVDNCLKMAENDPLKNQINDRESALSLLVNIWKSYPLYIEETPQLTEKILDLLKKGSRDKNFCLQIGSFAKLFELLDYLATDRNPLAALIYKKLTFSFIENHADIELRQFILLNFSRAFKKFNTIPTEILLEPLIRQIQVSQNSSYILNICDIEFLRISSTHPKLKLKMCIQLIDLLSKVYLNDLVYSQSIFDPISQMIARFVEDEAFQEYLVKLTKIALAMFFNSCKNKKGNKQKYDKYGQNLYDALNEANETEIINAQKRGLIIQLLKWIIEQQCSNLNDQLKPLLVHVYLQLKQIKQENKGVVMLLGLLGDPEAIIQEIEEQNQIQEQEERDRQARIDQYNQMYSEQQLENDSKQQQKRYYKGENYDDDKPKQNQENIWVENIFDNNQEGDKQSKMDDEFYQKNGIGLKQKNSEKQKKPEQERNLNSKAIMQIEQIKMRREEEQKRKQQEEELKKQKKEQQIKAAVEEINKRNAKLGVAKEGDSKIPLKLIYDQNTLPKDISKIEQIQLINIEELEERDRETLGMALKKYHKSIKALFTKYQNSTTTIKKGDFFAQMREKIDLISIQDIGKMIKENDLLDLCTKEELVQLIKLINAKTVEKGDTSPLDLDDFSKYLVQFALLIYSRPPKDMRGCHAGQIFEQLFKHIAAATKKRGENSQIYSNPEFFNVPLHEQQEINKINNALLINRDYPIPENYKKIVDKDMQLNYSLNKKAQIGIPQGYLYGYQIINDLFNKLFKVNIIEPITKITLVDKVKPKPPSQAGLPRKAASVQSKENQEQPQRQPLINNQEPEEKQVKKNMKTGQIGRLNNLRSFGDINQSEQAAPPPPIPQFKSQQNANAQERGRTRSPQKQIMNKVLQSKIEQQENELKQKKSKDVRIKQRQQELKEELEKIKELKKEQELKQKEEEKQKRLEQEEAERKKREKFLKEQELKKQKVREHQIKLEEEKKQKEQHIIDQKKELEQQKKKEVDEFMKKQKQKIEKDLQELKLQQQKEREEQEKYKEQERLKEEKRKKKNLQILLSAQDKKKNDPQGENKEEENKNDQSDTQQQQQQ
ncbi:hypothetical protein TTHERM_00640050 (macronuclear) [Tetrahymena thermophila SB210]|uniref:CH-like domain-containing protein n=1 Tax=Tetrahymena thermophila (strain SB210) TaxID=312017 RepID=Q23F28_TETTS|nr:hypothetical protein TTHERM_00640050 [Tetrahymena thermophila SB210]EAR95077.2 hypothetical protein TTHERM_00640050 [Tetrahymena thermophila SB210]|eukprot:XP_001015322.2 hypothetical protein TTHERM_00640050 [Tetrahymena thermophila SB210]